MTREILVPDTIAPSDPVETVLASTELTALLLDRLTVSLIRAGVDSGEERARVQLLGDAAGRVWSAARTVLGEPQPTPADPRPPRPRPAPPVQRAADTDAGLNRAARRRQAREQRKRR